MTAEELSARGYCPEPERSVPPPGSVGLDKRATCPACGKRVRVTVRGRFSHHRATDGGGKR